MKHQQATRAVALCAFTTIAILAGCAKDQPGAGPSTQPAMAADIPPAPPTGGAQLWSENCGRCHNVRSSTQYSAAQWDIIVHHMRLRANLTGAEQRQITSFLQAGS